MNTFFVLLLFLSLGGLVVGLIKPSLVKMKSRKYVGGILGGAAVVFVILVGATSPSRPPAVGTQTAPSQQAQGGPFIDKGMGDEVVLETLQFKVLDVKERGVIQDSLGSSAVADAGAKFIVVKIEITNLTNSNLDFPSGSNGIPLVDDQGRQYTDYDKTIGNIDNYLDGTVLPPGIAKQGVVVYEVPSSSTSYFLESGKGGTNDIYRVKLQPSSSAPAPQAAVGTPATPQQKIASTPTPAPVQQAKAPTQIPPSTPPAKPTATIQANGSNGSITIPYNTAATITWSSSNADSCNVSPGGWSGTSGSQSTGNLTTSQTYALSCTGAGGSASASVAVNVSAPLPPPAPSPITLSGNGQQATQKFTLQQGLSVFTMQNSGQSNFIVHLLDSQGNLVDGLANEVGSFSGSKPLHISATGSYLLNVDSDGPWSVTITQPRPASAPTTANLNGTGPVATAFFSLPSGLHTFTLTHDGQSNFIVHLLDKNGNTVDGLVNEIGVYSGSKAEHTASGIYLLGVEADGNWTVQMQ